MKKTKKILLFSMTFSLLFLSRTNIYATEVPAPTSTATIENSSTYIESKDGSLSISIENGQIMHNGFISTIDYDSQHLNNLLDLYEDGLAGGSENYFSAVLSKLENGYDVDWEASATLLGYNMNASGTDIKDTHYEEGYEAFIARAFKQNNYVQGLYEDCPESTMLVDRTSNEDCKALYVLSTSPRGQRIGMDIVYQLNDLLTEVISTEIDATNVDEYITKLNNILDCSFVSSKSAELVSTIIEQLNDKRTECEDGYIFDYESYDCIIECPDGQEELNGECVDECPDGYVRVQDSTECQADPSTGTPTGASGPNIPSIPNTEDPMATITVSPTPEEAPSLEEIIEEIIETECGEGYEYNVEENICEQILPEPENPIKNEDIEDNSEFINQMQEELKDVNMDLYENIDPEEIEIAGLKAQIYIRNDVDLMSNDNANFSKLIQNEDGTFALSSDDNKGKTTIYAPAYNADGELITDLVISSRQFAYVTFKGNNNLVSENSVIKLYGYGNKESFTAYGYGDVTIGNVNTLFGADANYKADETKTNRRDMMSIQLVVDGGETINDSVKGVLYETIYRMEDYNYNSYDVKATSMDDLGEATITLTLINTSNERVVEVAENGQKVTYKYQMNQVVTTSTGDIYSLIDVMKHNLYDLDVLITAGFEVTRNGELVTVDNMGDLSYGKLLGQYSTSLVTPTIDPENPDAPTATPTEKPSENLELVAIGDTLTPDKIEESNQNNPEYVWSSDTHDYYIPEGIVEDIEFKFYNEETEEYETLSFSDALARGYLTPETMQEALEQQGINVYAVEKLDTKPSFRVVTKELEDGEEYVENITKFWEDNAYEYAFENAETYDRTYILTSNGLKYTLDYVLTHNLYTIDELIENGLNCIKTTKAAGIVSSMAIIEADVYRDIYINEDTTNGGLYVGTKLFSSMEDVQELPEGLKTSLEEKFGSLDNYFANGKSFILYGICSENGKTSFATSTSVKDDTIYANIGYATISTATENDTMINYIDVIAFNNEDVLSKANNVEKISDMKVSVNIKDVVTPDDDNNNENDENNSNEEENNNDSNEQVAIVQTTYDTIIAHGQDINGVQLYNTLEEANKLPVEIKDEVVKRVGDLDTFFNEGKSFVLYGIESNTSHKPQEFYKIEASGDTLTAVIVNIEQDPNMSYGQAFTYYVDIVSFENDTVLANVDVDKLDDLKLNTRISETKEEEKEETTNDNEEIGEDSNEQVAITQTTYPNISRYGTALNGATLYTNIEQAKQLPEDIQQVIVEKVGDFETFFSEGKSFVLYGVSSNTSRKDSTLKEIKVENDKIVAVLTKIEDTAGTSYLQVLTNYVDMVVFENNGVLANSSVDNIDKLSIITAFDGE